MILLKNFNRQLATAAVCFLFIVSSMIVPVYAESGKCGKGLNWKLDGSTLTISGKGEMDHYTDGSWAPWYEVRNQIVEVVVKNGVENIGNAAFYNCENLRVVTLSNSVKTIGQHAFMECENLVSVNLGNGVVNIGDYAFKLCKSLVSISLPNTLEFLGYESFFSCESLVTITIPLSVVVMKECVFTYCTSLVQAYVGASISSLPEWTFYGCDSLSKVILNATIEEVDKYSFYNCTNLTTVVSGADKEVCNKIENEIKKDVPSVNKVVSNETGSSVQTTVNPDNGNVFQQDAVENENVSFGGSIVKDNQSSDYDIEINATIKNEGGWKDLTDKAHTYKDLQQNLNSDKPVIINIIIGNDNKVSGSVLNEFAGQNVKINILGRVKATIQCKNLDKNKKYSDFYLDFSLEEITNPSADEKKLLGDSKGFYLKFSKGIDFKIDIVIPLGDSYCYSYSTIFQKKSGKLKALQTVRVGDAGTATFYFDGVKTNYKYVIGINVKGIDYSNVYVPNELSDDYGGLTDGYGNRYTITGAKSKWGISLGQFSLILLGVFVALAAGIGGTMYVMNKRKMELNKIYEEVMSKTYDLEKHKREYKFIKRKSDKK